MHGPVIHADKTVAAVLQTTADIRQQAMRNCIVISTSAYSDFDQPQNGIS